MSLVLNRSSRTQQHDVMRNKASPVDFDGFSCNKDMESLRFSTFREKYNKYQAREKSDRKWEWKKLRKTYIGQKIQSSSYVG